MHPVADASDLGELSTEAHVARVAPYIGPRLEAPQERCWSPGRWARKARLVSSERNRRSSRVCAICENHPSTRRGEHVLPTWLLNDLFPSSDAPYTTHVNGVGVTNRDGDLRGSNHLPRTLLPMCNPETGGRCNRTLDTRFETNTARAAIRAMFAGGNLTGAETNAAGLWWLKTMLLSKHPSAKAADEGPERPVWSEPVDRSIYAWMVDGSGPPPYLSVWVSRRGTAADDDNVDGDHDVKRISLPSFEMDGTFYRSRVGLLGVRELLITLLVHPGWETTHPLESTRQAVRIFPSTGTPLSMAALVDCDASAQKVWGSTFAIDVRLMLADGANPLAEPWSLGPCWDGSFAQDLPGVLGAAWG